MTYYKTLEEEVGTNTALAIDTQEELVSRPTRHQQWNWVRCVNLTGQTVKVFFNNDTSDYVELENGTGFEITPSSDKWFSSVWVLNGSVAQLTASKLNTVCKVGAIA